MTELQAAMCAEFETMDREQQMDALQKDGVYIGKLKTDGHRLLYQYHTVYVEIVYSIHRTDIKEIRCLTDTAILDNYLSSDDGESQFPYA